MTGRTGWTAANARHVAGLLWPGQTRPPRVYESIGSDFFLAPAPGWLNLGLWDGPPATGRRPDPVTDQADDQAEAACRLVSTLAAALPRGGVILDVGNGLAAQDPVIAGPSRSRAACWR